MRSLILSVVAGLGALSVTAAEVVKTIHPSRDVVVAERVLAPADGASDSVRLQKAIDEVVRLGGGTVFLRAGVYGIDAPVVLRRGVTLRGDYAAAQPTASTVLSIVHGAGDADGQAAFSLEHGSGLVGLVFFYPEQSVANPVAYPWTVRTHPHHAGNNQTIDDCTFVNSWRAIAIGPETNECHTFRRVRICALHTGFFVDMTTDIGRVYEVTVSPAVWAESGFKGAPSVGELSARLKARGAVAADYARSDWEFIRGLAIDGYHIGARFRRGKNFIMNGVMAASRITDCEIALAVDEVNEVGLAVYDSVFERNGKSVVCSDRFDSVLMFHSCTFADGALVLGPKGTVNLRACAVAAPVDATAGGRLMRDDTPPAAEKVVFEPMAFARPQSDAVVCAAVDAKADDCTAAIQAALDRAGRMPGGATVYLPAGSYRCRGTLTVPTGVELRGASAVPHHTMSGGTVLFVLGGRGAADGQPFCSLRANAGLRGLSFWYPEQAVGEPVAYPWTVRALGTGCWMTDVNIANAWQGADFATHPSDGHRISYFSGGFYRTGLKVGTCSTTGWVEDVQQNTHYVYRRPGDHRLIEPPQQGRGEPPFMLYQRDWLQGIVFENCADERISGTFLYAARDGLVFKGRMNASVMIHGTDTGCRAFTVRTEKGSRVTGALVQLVALGAQVESAVCVQEGNAGDLVLYGTQFWPRYPLLEQRGTGRTVLDQFNGVAGPVKVFSGTAEVVNGLFRRPLSACVEVGETADVDCRGCVGERKEFRVKKGSEK